MGKNLYQVKIADDLSKLLNEYENSCEWLVTKTIETHHRHITPEEAKYILEHMNINNRRLNREYVNLLVRNIRSNEWELDGSPIKISNTGVLIDGQHRLHACVITGQPIETLIVTGLPNSAFGVVDTNRPRTGAMYLEHQGIKNAAAIQAAIKTITYYKTRGSRSLQKLSPKTISTVYHKYTGLQESCAKYKNAASGLARPSVVVGLHYLMSLVDPMLADDYMDGITKGMNLEDTEPAFVIRKKLLKLRFEKTHLTQQQQMSLVIKGWNCMLDGWRGKVMQWTPILGDTGKSKIIDIQGLDDDVLQ